MVKAPSNAPRRAGGCLRRILVAAGLLAALCPPASAEEWFDAYERGLEALQRQQPLVAINALERAVRMRPEPGANVLTYGTNRLPRYHPYLRLAEAYLLLGDAAGARSALDRSHQLKKEPLEERVALVQKLFELASSGQTANPLRPPPTPPATPVPSVAPTPLATPALPGATPTPGTPTPAEPLAAAQPLPTAASGTLDLASDPSDATVLLGGRLLGATPLRIDLPAGDLVVTLRKEGYAESTLPVRVTAGRVTRARRTLAALATPRAVTVTAPAVEGADPSSLVVISHPPGATVYLDDEPLGATDPTTGRLIKSGVAPGAHRIRLSRPNHLDAIDTVTIGTSGAGEYRGTLERTRGSHSVAAFIFVAGTLLLGLLLLAWRSGRLALTLRHASEAVTPSPATTASSPETISGAATQGLRRTPTPPLTPTPKTPRTPASGERFGEYTLVQQIGRGGMATVYKAERRGELCALKRPLSALLEDREFLERFRREADIGRTLHHPNIIRIQDRGEVEGVPYFTMELIEGDTLSALLRERGALEARLATHLIAQVAEALDYAHLKGVIHRDLKPSNIMVSRDGIALVMDYGIARARRFEGLTLTGSFLGTPDYVAPETAEGQGADARSDLYSLGVVFYEVLTGRRPFVGETPFATLKKHCSEAPTPPSTWRADLAPELEAVVLRLLEKDPAQRYASAEELLIALRELQHASG